MYYLIINHSYIFDHVRVEECIVLLKLICYRLELKIKLMESVMSKGENGESAYQVDRIVTSCMVNDVQTRIGVANISTSDSSLLIQDYKLLLEFIQKSVNLERGITSYVLINNITIELLRLLFKSGSDRRVPCIYVIMKNNYNLYSFTCQSSYKKDISIIITYFFTTIEFKMFT